MGETGTPMTVEDAGRVSRLEERLGMRFAGRSTALAALTHKSWVNEHRDAATDDNERLEFLGDAVIDLVVSEFLMSRFPRAREGDLSKLRAAVVDEVGLAAMARAFGIGEILRLGRGEELTGGREKASLLADAMEAVIAAVFLDGGLPAAHALVDRFLGDAYARAEAGSLDRDWKTQLQEVGQARYRTSPRYRVVAELGPDHSKVFEIEVDLRGTVLGRGTGRSKKDAEQAAARVGLAFLAEATEAIGSPEPIEQEDEAAPAGATPAAPTPAAPAPTPPAPQPAAPVPAVPPAAAPAPEATRASEAPPAARAGKGGLARKGAAQKGKGAPPKGRGGPGKGSPRKRSARAGAPAGKGRKARKIARPATGD